MLLAVALALAMPSVAPPDADHECNGGGRLAVADRTCVAVQVCAMSWRLVSEIFAGIRDPQSSTQPCCHSQRRIPEQAPEGQADTILCFPETPFAARARAPSGRVAQAPAP